jgi:hypothetical protein
MNAAVDFAAEQACGFEDAEMFRDGGQGDVERGRQFADRGFSLSETGEDSATSGVGQRAKSGVKVPGCRV